MKITKNKALILMRVITRDLFLKTIKIFAISMFMLVGAGVLTCIFFPSISAQVASIFLLGFGVTFGIMCGAMAAYELVWAVEDEDIPMEKSE